MTPAAIARKLRTFTTAGWRRQALVAEACTRMLVARVQILVRPFAKLAPALGEFVPPTDPRVVAHAAPTSAEDAATAKLVRWAVTSAAPFMPFRSVCLQQAMAAHVMLKRRGISSVMHFGARSTSEKPIDAHAWLDAAGVKVTGYPIPEDMGEIACFV